MKRSQSLPSGIGGFVCVWPTITRATAFLGTIRGRILIAFLVMSTITGALGTFAVMSIKRAGSLVEKTFDESLMSINYARAAATDFAAMRAAFAHRWITADPERASKLDAEIESFLQSFDDDLAIAAARSQSTRATQAAANVRDAALDWNRARMRLLSGTDPDISWSTLEHYADIADKQVDLLVNYTAGDGFIYRQLARASVKDETELNITGTVLALLFAAIVTYLLARRVVGPVATASQVAESIANADLNVEIPRGSADELGALLSAMRRMRDNLRTMMEREVEQRRLAQIRLADALESSREGIVIADSGGRLALANSQVADLLGISRDLLRPGALISELASLPMIFDNAEGAETLDVQLPAPAGSLFAGGRWLRMSRSPTRDGGLIAVCSDITVLKAQEATLTKTNYQLDAALDNMSQGLCLYDANEVLLLFNRRFCEIFELQQDQLKPGASYGKVLKLSIHAGRLDTDLKVDSSERIASGMRYHELSDGRVIASVCRSASKGGWVVTYEDVTERRKAEAKINHMARHDALTGLPNRILLREQMERALARVDRGEQLAVLYLDLDRFKSVNDTLGHPVGDLLLCAVTERLRSTVRGSDIVARLGGDEFAVIQTGTAQPTGATALATRIIETVARPFEIDGHQIVIGASVGIAVAPNDGNKPDQLLRSSDMALYRAKTDGRGTHHFFEPKMDAQMQERRILELDLRKALAQEEFELYFQPLIDATTRRVSGFEALVRWNHPTRGIVGPVEFIPLAEEIGLIGQLSDWVLRQACTEATSWGGDLAIAVNLSPAQFRNSTIVSSVVSALSSSGLAATRLELEITETVLLQDSLSVLNDLHALRALGVRISMDDFGTGYSSLSYLRSFPFDKIKIDRSFVAELEKKQDCVAIIRAVTGLGDSFGMTTTAEGVETLDQFNILRAEGCTQVQGYLFSPPRPAKDIPGLLKELGAYESGGKIESLPSRAATLAHAAPARARRAYG